MIKIATIPYKELHSVFVTNYYDFKRAGLCRHEGELCRFETTEDWTGPDVPDDCTHDDDGECRRCDGSWPKLCCEIFRLTPVEKAKRLWRKWLFEVCVGKHWTGPTRDRSLKGYVQTKGGIWVQKRNFVQKVLYILYFWRSSKRGHRLKFAVYQWKNVLR